MSQRLIVGDEKHKYVEFLILEIFPALLIGEVFLLLSFFEGLVSFENINKGRGSYYYLFK